MWIVTWEVYGDWNTRTFTDNAEAMSLYNVLQSDTSGVYGKVIYAKVITTNDK